MAFVLVPLGVLVLLGIDEAPPQDSDLRPRREAVADSENGFLAIELRDEDVDLPTEERGALQPFTREWDAEVAASAVERNRAVLDKLSEALRRPRFQVPEIREFDGTLPYIPAWRKLGALAGARVGLQFDEGKEAEAFAAALDLVRIGRRVEGAGGIMIVHLIGLGFESSGASLLCDLVLRSQLPAAEVQRLIERFEADAPPVEVWVEALRVEYVVLLSLFDSMGRGETKWLEGWPASTRALIRLPILNRVLFHANETKRLLAEALRKLAESEDGSGIVFPDPKLPPVNLVGKALVPFLFQSMPQFWRRRKWQELYRRAPRVLLALREHVRERGELPASLGELVPRHLPKVPVDPFTGEPLRYSRENRIVYSVGEDGVDSGGAKDEGGDGTGGDDQGWKLEF